MLNHSLKSRFQNLKEGRVVELIIQVLSVLLLMSYYVVLICNIKEKVYGELCFNLFQFYHLSTTSWLSIDNYIMFYPITFSGSKIVSSREFCPMNFKFNKRNLSGRLGTVLFLMLQSFRFQSKLLK